MVVSRLRRRSSSGTGGRPHAKKPVVGKGYLSEPSNESRACPCDTRDCIGRTRELEGGPIDEASAESRVSRRRLAAPTPPERRPSPRRNERTSTRPLVPPTFAILLPMSWLLLSRCAMDRSRPVLGRMSASARLAAFRGGTRTPGNPRRSTARCRTRPALAVGPARQGSRTGRKVSGSTYRVARLTARSNRVVAAVDADAFDRLTVVEHRAAFVVSVPSASACRIPPYGSGSRNASGHSGVVANVFGGTNTSVGFPSRDRGRLDRGSALQMSVWSTSKARQLCGGVRSTTLDGGVPDQAPHPLLGHHHLEVQDRPGPRRDRRLHFFQEAGRALPGTADEERCGRGSGNRRDGEGRSSRAPPDGAKHTGSASVRARPGLSLQVVADRRFELRAEAHEGSGACSCLVLSGRYLRQAPQGARDTESRRRGPDREPLGDLVVRQLADHAQLERLAFVLGEVVEGGRERETRREALVDPRVSLLGREIERQPEALARACLDAIEANRLPEDVPAIPSSQGRADPSCSSRKRSPTSHACANVSAVRSLAAHSSRRRFHV